MPHVFPHSMATLRALTDDAPPLVPETTLASARAVYDRFARLPPLHAVEIEEAIIAYGRVVWPYRKAFAVLVRAALAASPIVPAASCAEIVAAHVRARTEVRAAIGRDDREYRKLIREFQAIQHEMEEHIHALRRLAERAADHPEVFAEIVESVRTFERGFATLAREPQAKEICAAIEAHRERHAYLGERREAAARPKIFG